MIRDIIFAVMYGGIGLFLLLLILDVIRTGLAAPLQGPRKIAAAIICFGFVCLSIYHSYQFYRFSTPEGREILKKMRESDGNVIIGPVQ